MANYPAHFTLADSRAVTESGIEPERASNGTLKLRRLWPDDKATFDVGHVLTSTDATSFEAFYQANKNLDVTYRWPGDGARYTVRFVAPPRYVPRVNRVEVRVRLQEV
jgi:hypothetical protein